MVDDDVGDLIPVFVGNPVRCALQLEEVIWTADVALRRLGCLAGERNVVVGPDVQRRHGHRACELEGAGCDGAVPVQRTRGADATEARRVAPRMSGAETGALQRRSEEPATRGVDER